MTKSIPLTQGKFALVDDEDFEKLNQYKWHFSHGYAVNKSFKSGAIYMHRIIMDTPYGMETDHINGDRLDNRRVNLRVCTRTENFRNMKIHAGNTSGFKGVSWDNERKKWIAQIFVDGHNKFLGRFVDPENAARTYDTYASRYFGEFARRNFND